MGTSSLLYCVTAIHDIIWSKSTFSFTGHRQTWWRVGCVASSYVYGVFGAQSSRDCTVTVLVSQIKIEVT